MLLSVKRIEELNKLIAIEQKKAVDNKSRKNRLKELQSFEKTIVTSINHFLLDAGLVRSLLQLGTALRRGSEELSRHSSAIFRTLGKLFEKRCEISDFRYVIFLGLAEANKFVEFSTLGNSLVWHDEKQKIVDFLFDVREIPIEKLKKFKQIYQNEIAILSLGSQLSSSFWYKVEVLTNIAKSEIEDKELAKKAICYLLESKDVVDDRLGIFGLVDDIEVINQVFYSLKPEIVGEYLLEEFVALDNGLLSLLMERNTNIKSGINPLIGLSKPVLLSVLSVNFLLQSDKKRIVSLLPDPGLIALPQIASLMIAANRTPVKLDTNLPSGTDMYFNMPSVSLNVKYYGLHPELKDRLAVGDSSSKFSLPIEALRFATSKPRRKQVEVDPAKVLKWLTYDQSFVPPHISFNGSRFEKIVLLTNISKFKKNQKDFRPFGADLGTFIDFQYETTSGRVTSLFPQNIASKKAIVNVYSSPEIAFERLEEIGEKLSQTLLVCDDYRLANRFLGLMPDAWGFENLTIILIVDLHAREVQKTAAARNFLISAMHPHFDDLSHQDTQAERMISGRKSQIIKQNFSDKLSMFEKKLARSCRKPDIDFMQMQSSILDRFLDLEKKIWKSQKSGSQIGDNFLFKLQSFSSKVSKSWWPRSESDEEKINYIHEELLRFAVENASLEENIKDLYYLLEENKTELLNIPETRGIENYLKLNNEKKFYIFAEHETHANSIREYFNKIEVENCRVVSASGLIGNFISKPLIVPYLPVARFSKMLTSMSVSVRLIAFLSQNEKQSFLGRLQQAETQNRKLAISSYKSFANTPIEKTMRGIVKRFRQSTVRVEKETDILIDEKIREYSKKFAYQGNNSVDAVPIYFEENTKIILLSPRSSLISITENNEFELSNAADLADGNRICLLRDTKSDLLDKVADISNSKYTQKKSTASLWKSELKKILIDKFDNNFLRLQIALQDAGIQRSEATLKNWTNDTSIVAPQHFEETIIKLTSMDDISENFKQQKNEVIAAIDFCYSCRRESSKVLLNSLTSDAEYDDFNKEIRVNLLGELFKFDVFQITTIGSQISVSSEELWKIKAVD